MSRWQKVQEFIAARRRLEWTHALWKQWAEIPQFVVVGFGLVVVYYLFRRIDPDAGVDRLDIWGRLAGVVVSLLVGLLVTFSAWWCKKTYTRDLSDKDEELLQQFALTNWKAFWVLILDRVEWVLWIVFWVWLLSRF